MKIHVLGFPGFTGGASTELWHTLLLWRGFGCDVTLTPTWHVDDYWAQKCTEIGCEVSKATLRSLSLEPGVPVVSFCNSQFFGAIKLINPDINPTVWVPCMNYLTDRERRRYSCGLLPSAVVCQSEYQRSQIAGDFLEYGLPSDRIFRIRGAFDPSLFPYQPKKPNGEFVVGRISRADPAKFREDLWDVLGRVRDRIDRPLRACVLGWRPGLAKKVGPVPDWAEVHEPGAVNTVDLMRRLDVLYQSGDVAENWPRVGLEAMSTGLPVVADNKGGWSEMSDNGPLAALVNDADHAVEELARLAELPYGEASCYADVLRHDARRAIDTTLRSDESLWLQWKDLFDRITT